MGVENEVISVMESNEIWVPMKENPDYYEVSNLGNVRSVGFTNQWGYHRRKHPKMLRQRYNQKGYKYILLTVNDGQRLRFVHRLVASNFVGDINGKEVNHINGDKSDNRASNLEICSHSENMLHAYRTLGVKTTPQRPYNTEKKAVLCYDLNGKFVAEYPSVREAAEAIGHSHGQISIAARKEGGKAFGFIWRYKQ